MLFSNGAIRKYINANFLAAWENVRSVPIVTVDFGDGRTLKRTVLGNVATYICMPDGRVVDIIPGVNTPEAYLEALRNAQRLYLAAALGADVTQYHRRNGNLPVETFMPVIADFGKSVRIERPILQVVTPAADVSKGIRIERPIIEAVAPKADSSKFVRIEKPIMKIINPKDVTVAPDPGKVARIERPILYPPAAGTPERDSLEKDTLHNRTVRKPLIHKILSERWRTPGEITRRVYREVLHCDLDDPYLGLARIDFKGGGYESAPPATHEKELSR